MGTPNRSVRLPRHKVSSARSSRPTAAIIGAGSSGIAAAKALHERGVPFTCFEASDRVGGTWVFGNRNGMSAAYRGLHTNTSRERMAYSDFPMPASYPDYPHHTQIAAYLDAYVDHFGFRDRIRFQTKVQHASRRDDGVWELELADGSVEHADALLVANGHHWDPQWPEPMFPGHETFAGVQIHAHDYRDCDLFAGRRALIVGIGSSAVDIAAEVSYAAERTFLAVRRGAWIMPKYIFDRPSDQLPNDPRVPVELRMKAFETMIRLTVGPPETYGLPKPEHAFGQAHPTASDRIFDRLRHGAITPKPGIARLHPDEVEFADGSREAVDVVVYCTGYRITFPFFDPGFISAPDNRILLFRRVLHPDVPNLFFVGLVQPLGATMPIAESQGRWIADHLCGDYVPPRRAEMLSDIWAHDEAMRRRYVASRRHTIEVDFDDYLLALERERREGAYRAQAADRLVAV
jgi:dimethylaniline monooxygenase (N-oxide forming)